MGNVAALRRRAGAPRRRAARGTSPTRAAARLGPPSTSASSSKTARASGRPGRLRPAATRPAATSRSARIRRRVEEPPHDELRRDRAVPAVLLEPEARRSGPRAAAVELRAHAERDRAAASRPCWRTRKRRCFPSPTVAGSSARSPHQQRHVRIAEPERRQPAELAREVERERGAGDDGVDDRDWPQVALAQHGIGMRCERVRERLEPLLLDRQPRCGAMAAEPFEVLGARAERRRAGRTPTPNGPSPSRRPPPPRSARPAG